ncbi:MAG: nucleotidyltransferase domain-containing protein [Anaerolineae bacterium]|nr:nucleotidyltransferase domain-containing protein [Anaerolineae bacterium]
MNLLLKKPITIETLRQRRDDIIQLANRHGGLRVRVFGSVARGEATDESDVDFLVQFREGTSMWDLVGLWQDLGELLGCDVSVVPDDESDDRFMQNAHRDAVLL